MKRLPLLLLIVCGPAAPAHAYIEGGTPTLGKLTNDAVHIVVLQVDKVNRLSAPAPPVRTMCRRF